MWKINIIQRASTNSLDGCQNIELIRKGPCVAVYKIKNKTTNIYRAMKVISKYFDKLNPSLCYENIWVFIGWKNNYKKNKRAVRSDEKSCKGSMKKMKLLN